MSSYYGIGIMSGASLDGLDLCFAEFTGDSETDVWGYRIEHAVTVPYSKMMKEMLEAATSLSGFVSIYAVNFIQNNDLRPDFVASYGHSVFHQPDKGITFQLGEGEIISTYISNFQAKDVALGGQGAPLVPCGEKFLFQQTDICVNLCGIATVGCQGEKGFDVCPCNMVLNHLASAGHVLPDILEQLDKLDYYQQSGPKSLGFEWVSSNLLPILKINSYVLIMVFICIVQIVDTEDEIVEYKEALVYAFLGLRSLLNMENVFSSVTGSRMDSVSGSIHHGTVRHSRPSLQDRFNFMIRRKSLGVTELRIVKDK
ncbi:unnamed protein product [Candidula unifasciata]|uniref:Anhydro-N-acetylmuramic acid kinase n=1 Tax=Candidula unifasciata TaxID=100452 RepID=A0A8S3ZPK2_9EUPU|nr:unnamed protein product [Candidula unifasciata]